MFHLYRNVILKILKGTNDGSFYMITKQTKTKKIISQLILLSNFGIKLQIGQNAFLVSIFSF